MRPNRALEIGTGLFILLGFAALIFLTTQLPSSGLSIRDANVYRLSATFDNIGDLKEGAPISMSGVNVGRVTRIAYDSGQYKAVVDLSINKSYDKIPDDSDASIQTQGLLGGKYIALTPGGSETYFKDGGRIGFTQSAIVLESLINKLFASMADKGKDKYQGADAVPTTEGAK
jgi:phospholipid/cholesterol/gamma-HCH transport system substrate-binding protein